MLKYYDELREVSQGEFLQPDIREGGYFDIETTQGVECVPGWLFSRTVSTPPEAFLDYLEGDPLNDDLVEFQEGFVARLSAPGYLDSTTWTGFKSERDAVLFLVKQYSGD